MMSANRLAWRTGSRNSQHPLQVVAGGDQEVGDVLDLVGRLAGGEAGELDQAVAEELEVGAVDRSRDHRQQVVRADVDGEAQPAVEREPLAAHPLVEDAQLGGGEEDGAGAARRVERPVAEELLELQAVALADLLDAPEEAHHQAHRLLLGGAPAAAQLLDELGELDEVVEQAVAAHRRRRGRRRIVKSNGRVERRELHELALQLRHRCGPRSAIRKTRSRRPLMTSKRLKRRATSARRRRQVGRQPRRRRGAARSRGGRARPR